MARKNKKQRTEEYKKLIENLLDRSPESAHQQADQILCDLLDEIGYWEITEQYLKLDRFYNRNTNMQTVDEAISNSSFDANWV